MSEDHGGGVNEQHECANGEQDAKLRRSHLEVADGECAEGVRGEHDLDAQHQIRDQQHRRDLRAHVTGGAEAGQQEQRAEGIDDVVHVEAVSRPLLVAHARERAIQAVAEPVDRQTDCARKEHVRVLASQIVAKASAEHRHETEQR